jgi:hypothetical protein
MKYFSLVSMLLLTTSLLTAGDDVYVRAGYVYKNTKVLDTVSTGKQTYANVLTSQRLRKIPLSEFTKIVYSPYDSTKETVIEASGFLQARKTELDSADLIKMTLTKMEPDTTIRKEEVASTTIETPTKKKVFEYPNLKLLPISVLSIALSVDYLMDANKIDEDIDDIKKIYPKQDVSSMEGERNRKRLLGITFSLVGLVNTLISIQSVEVSASPNSLSVSYRF